MGSACICSDVAVTLCDCDSIFDKRMPPYYVSLLACGLIDFTVNKIVTEDFRDSDCCKNISLFSDLFRHFLSFLGNFFFTFFYTIGSLIQINFQTTHIHPCLCPRSFNVLVQCYQLNLPLWVLGCVCMRGPCLSAWISNSDSAVTLRDCDSIFGKRSYLAVHADSMSRNRLVTIEYLAFFRSN